MSLFSELGDTTPALPDRSVLEGEAGGAGQFTRGLRSGTLGAGSQLSALGGAVADKVGLRDTAQGLYDTSDQLTREAAEAAPRVTSFRQVRGLRDALDYGSGLLGQTAPSAAAALGAGLATGGSVVPAALAAGAVQAPLEIGDVVQRQRAAGQEVDLGDAALVGGGSALLQGAVPGAVAGKLAGRAAAPASRSAASIVGRNLAAVPGEAATEAAGEAVKQLGTTGDLDTEALLEAGVGGAVGGSAFAGLGAAGELANRGRTASQDPAKAPIPLDDAGKPVAAPPAASAQGFKDLFDGAKDKVDDAAERISQGIPLGDLKKFAEAKGDQLAAMADEDVRAKFDKVKGYADELLSDAGLTPEKRTQLTEAAKDLGSDANQRIVAGLKRAKDLGANASEAVQGLYDSIKTKLPAGGGKRSDALPDGLRKAIGDVVTPILRERNPALLENAESINKLGDSLRSVLQVAMRDGQVDEATQNYLQRVFGSDTRTVLEELHGVVADAKDKAGSERFFAALNDLADNEARSKTEREVVQENLLPELKDTVSEAQLEAAVNNIRSFVRDEGARNASKAESDYRNRQFREQLQSKFGAKADTVLEAFSKRAKPAEVIDDRGEFTDSDARDVEDEKEPTQYLGGGKDKEKPELLLNPNDHRQQFANEGQAERLLKQAQAANPDRVVRFLKAKDYAKETGMSEEALRIATKGEPDKYGIVAIEGTKQEGRITPQELDRMKLDTSKTANLKNASRIDTGVNGVTLDARRMTKVMAGKLPYIDSDDLSTAHRLGRSFMEAVAAAQAQIGKAFEVPGSTVVALQNGKALTYAQVKQMSFANPKGEPITEKLAALREQYRGASDKERRRIKQQADAMISRRDREIAGEYDDTTDPVKDYLEASGRQAATKDDQIHIAADQIKGKDLENRTNLDGSPRDTTPPKRDINTALKDLVAEMRASSVAAQRALATRLERILAYVTKPREPGQPERVSEQDYDALTELLATRSASDRAAIINRVAEHMNRKTGRQPADIQSVSAAQERARPKAEAAGQAALIAKAKKGDPDAAYSLQTTNPANQSSAAVRSTVETHIEKVLGPQVKVIWEQLPYAGEFTVENGKEVIRLSVHSLDPMSVAFHESLHGFLKRLREAQTHETANTLFDAANEPHVVDQLRKLLKNEPDALKQLDDAEERVAYMYQFWAQGQLNVAPAPAGVLGKIKAFIQKTLGIWSNDQRALHIMEYFNSGKYAADMSPSAVARATLAPGRNAAIEKAKELTRPLADLADSLGSMGSARLRDTGVPALRQLADLIKLEGTSEGKDPGFIQASRVARTARLNRLGERLAPYSREQINEAREALQTKQTAASPEARLAARAVRKTLDEAFDYMRTAGVAVNDMGYGKDYFPRVYNADYISRHQAEFRTLLEKHGIADPDEIISKLMINDGSELHIETLKPGMQHLKTRRLASIPDAELAPFMRKDLFEIMDSYITQAARRAEWARRFRDDGGRVNKLLAQAKREGATARDIEVAQDFIRGVDGTLGDEGGPFEVTPTTRRVFGNILVYQNIRLLPLAIFSSVVDPVGIAVRGGSIGDAWDTFTRGVRESVKSFQKHPERDDATRLAETLGVIENASLSHTIGALYSQGMVGDTARKFNDMFFRYNLMEQWNRSARVGATEAALKFIARHADGRAEPHSARWTRELGLEPADVKIVNGRVATSQADGLSAEQVVKLRTAVNRWVDGAVLRPNAADKPIWMNDPHWVLVAHLKQFVYSFHETILKRVVHEYQNGNYAPAMALASYVPIMIAADFVKGLIQGGGEQPQWKKGWDAGDYVWSGVQRAGLLGVGQFALEGPGGLAGPTLEQLGRGVSVATGESEFGSFVLKSMPANALYSSLAIDSAETPAAPRQ